MSRHSILTNKMRIVSITFLTFFSFCFSHNTTAQRVRIVNKEYQLPIEDVFVYNHSMTANAISNAQGEIDLSDFVPDDTLIFQHPGFETVKLLFQEAIKRRSIILTEKIITFDEVVVSANKFQQSKADIAQDIISIKGKKLEFYNPQTSADLLSNSGQVYVQKSQFGGGSPTLRGFAANSVLLVVDGIRLNNGIYRSGNLQNVINIDPNAIARTEVVFGPGSVIYGSDALGGVMDFTTKSPIFSNDDDTEVVGNALARYSTAAREKTIHTDLSIGRQKWAYFGSFSFSDFDDLRAGSNRNEAYQGEFLRPYYVVRENQQDVLKENEDPNLQRFSGFSILNTIHKLAFNIDEKRTITYGLYYSTTSDVPRYDRLTIPVDQMSDTLENAEWYYGPQRWLMHSLSYKDYSSHRLYDQLQINVAYQDYKESRNDRGFGDDRLRTRTEKVDVVNTSIDLQKDLRNGVIYYGFDGFFNAINSSAIRTNILTGETTTTGTRYPDEGSTFSSAALYSSYRRPLSDKWKMTAGLRINQVWLTANTSEGNAAVLSLDNLNISNQAVTGSAGLLYSPGDKSQWKASFSSGFRSPNVDDIGKVFELDDALIVVPNPDLQPEYVYSSELSYRRKIGSAIQVEIVGYYSLLTNAIVRDEFSLNGSNTIIVDGQSREIRAQVNAKRAHLYGGTARLKAKISEALALMSVFSINEGFEEENREPLRHITPKFGQTVLAYKGNRLTADLISNYHLSLTADDIRDSEFIDKPHLYTEEGTPGWYTLDIRTGFRFSNTFDLEAGVENIFDLHYRTYSSGISAPGRNLYLTGKVTF